MLFKILCDPSAVTDMYSYFNDTINAGNIYMLRAVVSNLILLEIVTKIMQMCISHMLNLSLTSNFVYRKLNRYLIGDSCSKQTERIWMYPGKKEGRALRYAVDLRSLLRYPFPATRETIRDMTSVGTFFFLFNYHAFSTNFCHKTKKWLMVSSDLIDSSQKVTRQRKPEHSEW